MTKTLQLMTSGFLALSFAGAAYAAETTPAPVTKSEISKEAKKLGHKEAKEACLKENAGLKGKALGQCVKSKRS